MARLARGTRRTAVLTALLAALSAAVLVAPAAAANAETAEAPGDIVAAELIDAPGYFYARVWLIEYLSTDAHGAPITVSGTVIVPHGEYAGPRPIIGYAPGTHGMGDQCAASRHLEAGDENEGGLIHQYAKEGFAVAVTDYQGLGTPGDHTYMVAQAAGHAQLDVVRAAQRLPDAGLPQDGPIGLAGYSQGGHATSWSAQLADDYAPELSVLGAASGGTPAHLRQVADANQGKENFGFVLAAGIGMDAAYPELDLESYLNDAGREGVDTLRNSCDFSPYAYDELSDYTTTNPLETPQWQAVLDAQNVGAEPPTAPVLLYHSTGDEIIPYDGATTLRQQWCDQGANVTFETYELLGHAATAAVASPSVTSWMADRLAGEPTAGNC